MSIKQNAVQFLEALGFDDVRVVQGDSLRLIVRNTIKQVRKCLKSNNMKFTLAEQESTPKGVDQRYLVIQKRAVIGKIVVQCYATHSIIELINL